MPHIHPTAIIEHGAEIADTARIGAYCHVGSKVVLGDAVELVSHVVVAGRTSIGEGTRIFPFASIGHPPQDLKYQGEDSALVIGKRSTIREHVTMNPGTTGGGMVTRVGDDCAFLASAHVAHDCIVGNHVIMVNNATLAGHVTVGDRVNMGGMTAVHQFTRIGRNAFVGGASRVSKDVPPFVKAVGSPMRLYGLNTIGLQRAGFPEETIRALKQAYRLLFRSELNVGQAAEQLEAEASANPEVQELVAFVQASERGVAI